MARSLSVDLRRRVVDAIEGDYRVERRRSAVFVRDLYRRYLEIGSVVRLKALLDAENVRLGE
jgi:hypothetical protein